MRQAVSRSVAWGGLLANFAAGAFLIFLRPFKVGDDVTAGGVTGTVEAISLFGTTIITPDNVVTIVGNNKIFSDVVQNFSANPYRRVDLTAAINNAVDHRQAIRLLKERLSPSERPVDARARCGDSPVHAGGAASLRVSVLQQCALLAGVLRYEPADSGVVRRCGLPAPVQAYAVTGPTFVPPLESSRAS